MPLDDTTANAIYSSNLDNLRRGGGVVGGGVGAVGGGLLGHAVGRSFKSPVGRGISAGVGALGGGIAGVLAGKRLGELSATPMTNSQLRKLEEALAAQPVPQDDLYGVMPPEYFKQAENFPVPAIDVSTYSPNQGSVYPMAGITSLRPNPQVKATFFDTDATGARRNLNIGQEQSPMKTPEMPELPKKEGADKNDKNWVQRHPVLTAGLGGAGLLAGGGIALHHFRPGLFSSMAQKGIDQGIDGMTDTVNRMTDYVKNNPDSFFSKKLESMCSGLPKISSYSRGYFSTFRKLAIDDSEKAPEFTQVKEFEKKLKPGDIILSERKGEFFYPLLIKAFTGTRWGHAGLYAGDGTIKHISKTRHPSGKRDLEAGDLTLRDHSLETFAKGNYDMLAVRPDLTKEERAGAAERMKDLGHPTFSYRDFLRLGAFPWGKKRVNEMAATEESRKKIKKEVKQMTCAGAVALSYPTIDFRKNKSKLFVRPSDFLDSDKTKTVAKFKWTEPKTAEAIADLVLDKVSPSTRCVTGTSGVVGFPGKQEAPAMATPEKPEVRGDTGAAIWR